MMGDSRLTSPLWSGEWPLSLGDEYSKLLALDTAGTFAITDTTNGHVLTVRVHDGGTIGTTSFAARTGAPDLPPDGLEMSFGGGKVTIPGGALPDLSGTPAWTAHPYYEVSASHAAGAGSVFHDAFTDGDMHFSLKITPEPPRLLKPITITLPYDPATYKSAPFLGIYDRVSGLYYDTGVAGNAATRTMTITLPAQTYGAAAGATPAAAASEPAATPAAAAESAGPPPAPSSSHPASASTRSPSVWPRSAPRPSSSSSPTPHGRSTCTTPARPSSAAVRPGRSRTPTRRRS